MQFKLNKEYNDEIVYETMLKMGFYGGHRGNSSSDNICYYYGNNLRNFDIMFNDNTIYIYPSSISEFLFKNNIMKLSNTEPSTLIDVQEGDFSRLNNIKQKMIITFIEEFDRIYTSIEN